MFFCSSGFVPRIDDGDRDWENEDIIFLIYSVAVYWKLYASNPSIRWDKIMAIADLTLADFTSKQARDKWQAIHTATKADACVY